MSTIPSPGMRSSGGSAGAWGMTASAGELAAHLRGLRRVVITTHAKPDGDAAGSTLALARSLESVGIGAEVWWIGPAPSWAGEISGKTRVREFVAGRSCTPTHGAWDDPSPDAVVVLDTGSWTQVVELRPWLMKHAERCAIVDHHLHGDADMAPRRIVDTGAASCTQVLAPVCTALLGSRSPRDLPLPIAEALYLGLATDTGWLRFSNVTPATLRLAADLIEAGVDHTRLYRLIEQQDRPGRWKLLARALASLELHDRDRFATMQLTLRDFSETGTDASQTSGFADMLLSIESVCVSAVLTEHATEAGQPPLTKFSLRSKPGPDAVDVNEVCRKLGGGGHARAAGAKANMPLGQAKAALLSALRS